MSTESFRTLVAVWVLIACRHAIASEELPSTCDSLIYCQGDLLHTVQMAKLDDDSKLFVDKSLINDVETTLTKFYEMMNDTDQNPSPSELEDFVQKNFMSENELDEWIPEDFKEDPIFLSQIADEEVRKFAKEIVAIWKNLGRKVKDHVCQNPDQHSLIYVPNGFIIPGGRFREYYYWDSYWIIEGLLVCGMTDTVRGMIDNFLSIVNIYGHVPNGGRVYYVQRSQPPLLSFMARRYYEETNDIAWLRSNVKTLEKEVEFWVKNRMVSIEVNGKEYVLGTHNARSAGPRPESYYEDYLTANYFKDEKKRTQLYIDLKSAAESGWDFSSRWIFDETGGTKANLSYTKTTRVGPVDLNSYLYGAFDNIAKFYADLNDAEKQTYWNQKAYDLNSTINELLWNEEDSIWYDYDLKLLKQRRYFSAANLAPLWTKAYNTEEKHVSLLIRGVVHYLQDQGITDFLGGIPTTIEKTGEQWDLPNAWPCIQSVVVNGLEKSGVKEGIYWARKFAERWIEANMIGYNETGYLFEKYDAENPGQYGSGGEYKVQMGFGWTNGVALEFIKKYYSEN